MAKIKHNNFLDTVDEIFTNAKKNGVFHLYSEDEFFTGRKIQIESKSLFHFGTTSYLNLELDERLKEAAIQAINKYGTQFPLSKTYLSFVIYKELEEALFRMYENPVLVAKNSTLCHLAVIPSVIRDEDVVILDHQVHNSVQSACQMLKPRGIPVDMIRHSNLNMLEDKIKEYRDRHKKIWYMIDGVYSMYGDCAPIEEIILLLEKYPQLHLYADDVHGMSWIGKNGTGYLLSKIKSLHEKIILISTLSKSFGASGAVMITSNKELHRYVKTFGGPLSFSAQLEPAGVAAANASAKIHLSPDIYRIQNELSERINYCNELFAETNLPLIEKNDCPVFFVGTGLPASGYNLSNRLLKEGFYVNLGIFPAVPVKNTGIRFTISRGNNLEDIKNLVQAIDYHYPKMLEEMDKTANSVRKAFKLPLIREEVINQKYLANNLSLQVEDKIENIDKTEWNKLLGENGSFDWDGLKLIEESFSNNEKPEHNWSLKYFIVRDQRNHPVIATFFTSCIWKEDMLAPTLKSRKIEEERTLNPYYLTSRAFIMGSLLTEGNHIYIDQNNLIWKEAFSMLFEKLADEQEKAGSNVLLLRDFEDDNIELKNFFISQGFVKVNMPETCVVEDFSSWNNEKEYLSSLSLNSRKHLKKEVLKMEKFYEVEYKDSLTEKEIDDFYRLYLNVKGRNFDVNYFEPPKKLIQKLSDLPNFEFITLKIKGEYEAEAIAPISIIAAYKSPSNNYIPIMIGMDYNYLEKYGVYRQSLFQVLKRAKSLNVNKLFLGFSASIEKKKFGSKIIPKIAYIQAKDNFNLEYIESLSTLRAS
ncbi:MAG TPA: aminotransferase class I/II-fold pyridoxal phosphate-dependent enzyme [Cytophagales bacterium]|nr:aminotransferase class I/II-fold pyridoxal phosphate-dependent enzyme [Cytophagales bacterium]